MQPWKHWAIRAVAVFMFALTAIAVVPRPASAALMGRMVSYRMTMPVQGSHFFWETFWDPRSHGFHHAIDVMADKMVPVVAAATGTVRLVNWTSQSHMNPHRCCTLALRHDDGWESWYIHLNNDTPGTDDGKAWGIAPGIRPGTRVNAGQLIGWVGDSGNSEYTAPHLHFELRDPSGTVVNPFSALVAAGGNPRGGITDPLFQGSRVLSIGDTGADVARLQEVLALVGFPAGSADGWFGSGTDAAVRAFQRSRGLTADGVVGSGTKSALKAAPKSGPVSQPSDGVLREGDRGAAVRELQQELKDAGFSPGPVDGVFGPGTREAVMVFQRNRGLTVDGAAGPQTLAALDDDGGGSSDGVLREGDRGDAVRELQQELKDAGFSPGPVDGVFGPGTREAVMAFQRNRGLTVDGAAGPQTLAALDDDGGGSSDGVLREGDRGDAVRELQQELKDAGFSPGPVDGVFGPGTREAVMAFQRNRGLTVDGLVGPRTAKALGI